MRREGRKEGVANSTGLCYVRVNKQASYSNLQRLFPRRDSAKKTER